MSRVRVVVVLSVLALLLACAPAATAETGCQAPPGTAAVDQYCENLPSAGGTTDPSGKVRRLASLLPKPLAERLRRDGVLGEVLLALPAGDLSARSSQSRPPAKALHRTRFEPVLDALLPGPAAGARSVVGAAAGSNDEIGGGLGWALAATMFCLALISLWGALRRE